MNLDTKVTPAMTRRDVLLKALDEDWNFRRAIEHGDPGQEAVATIYIKVRVPMSVAKEVWENVKRKEAGNGR